MKKVIKDDRGKYLKGTCGNPKGRPKGTANEQTKAKFKLYQLAIQNSEEAFNLLMEAIRAKEAWAHQLFFKDLLPKKSHQPTIIINSNDDNTGSRIEEIVKELKNFNELTYEEAINEIKTFKYDPEKIAEEAKAYSREELIQQLKNIKEAINYANKS